MDIESTPKQTCQLGINNAVGNILSGGFTLSDDTEHLTSLCSKVASDGIALLDSRELSLFETILLEEVRLFHGSQQLVLRNLYDTERKKSTSSCSVISTTSSSSRNPSTIISGVEEEESF